MSSSDDQRTSGTGTERDDARREKALADLARVSDGSEVVGTSAFSRTANRAARHFAGADADPEDRIEVWGRRIGRTLGFGFLIFLAVYLWLTYLA